MKKIYITGVSGTGKTTIAKALEKIGYYTISIDEVKGLCSWIHQETGQRGGGKNAEMNVEFVDKHDWICDIKYLNQLLSKDVEVAFVLGRATNQEDFLHIFDKILLLQCSPETFCKRIEIRTDNTFGKDKKVQQQIIDGYQPYTEKMLKKGAIVINTDRPIEEVVDEIIKQALC
jgi:dephospho-CoA kinase